MWVFGYGSIIFRPGFPALERRVGYIRGWARRFWQGSTDHRGVPGAPGRVVTLVEDGGERCWGVAYRLEGVDADRILAELDHREKGGYVRVSVDIHVTDPDEIVSGALTYVGTPANPNYLGPASLDAIARQILTSRGPSGTNVDYLERLAQSLRDMGVDDSHVFAVEAAVGALQRHLPDPSSGERRPDGAEDH